MFLKGLGKYSDVGLLIMRLGLGAMMVFHGLPKLMGGPEKWAEVGGAMGALGITFFPVFWGLMAAVAETFGAILLAIGLAFRPAAILLACTMAVAAAMHLKQGDGLSVASHAIELGIVFLSLILIGPGKLSFDKR